MEEKKEEIRFSNCLEHHILIYFEVGNSIMEKVILVKGNDHVNWYIVFLSKFIGVKNLLKIKLIKRPWVRWWILPTTKQLESDDWINQLLVFEFSSNTYYLTFV